MKIERIWLHLPDGRLAALEPAPGVNLSEAAREVIDALELDAEAPGHPLNTGELFLTGDYVLVRPSQLGFASKERLADIVERAVAAGLRACTFESASQARALFADQEAGASVLVVTFGVDVAGIPRLFSLQADENVLWIEAVYGDEGADEPYELINPDALLMFQLAPDHPFYLALAA